jgi:large subunit ribosomal protein L13
MKTQYAKKNEIERKWYVVDAHDQVLGRLASQIASRLRGKHKPQFTPNSDTGDFIIVVNAEKVKVTGRKLDDKIYYSHSGYPGGLRSETVRERLEKKPEDVIRAAVRGMLPKNRLGRVMITKLKVFTGPDHRHEAQKPETIELGK